VNSRLSYWTQQTLPIPSSLLFSSHCPASLPRSFPLSALSFLFLCRSCPSHPYLRLPSFIPSSFLFDPSLPPRIRLLWAGSLFPLCPTNRQRLPHTRPLWAMPVGLAHFFTASRPVWCLSLESAQPPSPPKGKPPLAHFGFGLLAPLLKHTKACAGGASHNLDPSISSLLCLFLSPSLPLRRPSSSSSSSNLAALLGHIGPRRRFVFTLVCLFIPLSVSFVPSWPVLLPPSRLARATFTSHGFSRFSTSSFWIYYTSFRFLVYSLSSPLVVAASVFLIPLLHPTTSWTSHLSYDCFTCGNTTDLDLQTTNEFCTQLGPSTPETTFTPRVCFCNWPGPRKQLRLPWQ
jgi:hypothetical protein